ncbi:BnaC03g44020D [Brassica napus]|uniref:(rape) hypothetical protein n=1 Tax=Brassica napus TaxID=3708 RepID=A0A078IKT2_BRANA|nr:unnamed protein product [Brassica napus]CDY50611.1 BnaC03g44020D [Brassica napus]
MASSNTSWSLLPFDLVENILYRLPVASLVRFKSTCKQWCALLIDKRFIYKHLDLSREGFIRVQDHKSFQVINLETLDLSSLQGPDDIDLMIHCDGLLLCRFDNRDNNLVVWIPFLSRVKWIELSSSYTGPPGGIYGFGYDNVSRDNYKILRFKRELEYETYCVPFVNGFGEDRLSLLSEHKDETMIQVWVTNKVTDEIGSWSKYLNVTYEIVTRSKYFNVFSPCLSILSTSNFPTYFIHKTNRIMLWYEKEDHQDENIYVNLYEIGGGEVKKLVETGRHRRWDMCDVPKLCYVFVPNLVPVPE